MNHSALPLQSIDLKFTHLKFYEHFVVSEPREGVVVKEKQLQQLSKACLDFYDDRKFVYIANRERDYSISPVIYLKLKEAKNLLGIAVVTTKVSAINSAYFEKSFSTLPFEIFLDMEEAKAWATTLKSEK